MGRRGSVKGGNEEIHVERRKCYGQCATKFQDPAVVGEETEG